MIETFGSFIEDGSFNKNYESLKKPDGKDGKGTGSDLEHSELKSTERHETIKKKFISTLPNGENLDTEHVDKLVSYLDGSRDTIATFMKQGSEQENYQILYDAYRLKQTFGDGISLKEALDHALNNRKVSDILLQSGNPDDPDSIDITNINKIISQVIDEGGDPLSEIIIPETTRFTNEDILGKVKVENDQKTLNITELNSGQQKKIFEFIEQRYAERFDESISKYLKNNQNANINTLYNDTNLFELYVQYYNVQKLQTPGGEENTIDTKNLPPETRQEINKHFNVQLKLLKYNVSDVDETLFREKEERERRINEKIHKIIEERNKRINNMLLYKGSNIKQGPELLLSESIDPNDATGAEIAAEANLGEELDDYQLDIKKNEHKSEWAKEAIFRKAYKDFINSHNDIKKFITPGLMHRLFDINNNIINHSEWELFKSRLSENMSPDEVEKIYNTLLSFSNSFKKSEEELNDKSSDIKVQINKTVKTHAIGAVIDNVRDVFESITEGQSGNSEGQNGKTEGFKLVYNKPVQKIGDDIIISGTFNSSEVKVRYDLKTGKLFMNSFLHKLGPDKISLGTNFTIDYPIGAIKPFNDVLNDYYKLPPRTPNNNRIHKGFPGKGPRIGSASSRNDSNENVPADGSPHMPPPPRGDIIRSKIRDSMSESKKEAKKVLNSQIDLISEAIEGNMKTQAQKNSSIINFMRTFNIMSEFEESGNLDFNSGSNLFDIIQIIDNTSDINGSNTQSLEYFNNTFMPIIMEYSGLAWGHNNLLGSQRNEKNSGKYDATFNDKGTGDENENLSLIKIYAESFSKSPGQRRSIKNYNNSHQLGFADLITKDLINGTKPNWILDKTKMEEFIKNLEAENEDENLEERLLEELEEV